MRKLVARLRVAWYNARLRIAGEGPLEAWERELLLGHYEEK